MRVPVLSLATQVAIIIAVMLLLSVGLAFLGVNWYSSYLEEALLKTLPVDAAKAYNDINAGIVPENAGLKVLLEQLSSLSEPLDSSIYLSVLVSGLLSALLCSVIGIYLTRRITQPLQQLTKTAEALRSGDFSIQQLGPDHGPLEVLSLVDSFNDLAFSLQQMENRLSFNNMAVAHELRTPLTILRGTIQGMIDGVFPMEKEALGGLVLQIDGLSRIVEDLRTLSLAIGQKLVMHCQMTDLSELISDVLISTKPMLNESLIKVELDLMPILAFVDAQRIKQAFLAIIENTCRYAGQGTTLRCSVVDISDDLLAVQICDNGSGFPSDMSFTEISPFWRGEESRSRITGGTGLGLSVVQAIVVAHGGRLELSNKISGGALCSMTLPKKANRERFS
ncbi:ATP-binding protein [Brucella pseudogrignonensis]|uniref:histidine kinase n=1 Tax=Brucella pseudogrignonensis TaxID=419475 RepID=A0ABU1MG11_9HYPH|nr:ATP-binding protein [Brucella pseudogrignonensis]MDR6434705.1 two-component system sensor histidine kinase AdeS [Brucella pseudogrignonensis]